MPSINRDQTLKKLIKSIISIISTSAKTMSTITIINPNYDWKANGIVPPRENFAGRAKLVTIYNVYYIAPYVTEKVIDSQKIIWI